MTQFAVINGKLLLPNGQDCYTPDVGVIINGVVVLCGICGTACTEKRNIVGPRGFAQAWSGGKSAHDSFVCPNINVKNHQIAKQLYSKYLNEISPTLKAIFLKDYNEMRR